MALERRSPTVVNTEIPEYLLVAGGNTMVSRSSVINTLEILVGEQWLTPASLPFSFADIKHTLHNGCLYLYGGSLSHAIMYHNGGSFDNIKPSTLREENIAMEISHLIYMEVVLSCHAVCRH